MNYGKYKFEQSKREKEARKNQHVVEIKEIRMSPGIDVGDFNTKLKNAQKFLADGNRVKVSVRFRGREMAHTDIGRDLLKKFAELCSEVATLDKAAAASSPTAPPSARSTAAMSAAPARSSPTSTRPWGSCRRRSRRCS